MLVIIGGLLWWSNQSAVTTTDTANTNGTMASSTVGGTDTSGTNTTPAPVVISKNNSSKSIASIVAGLTGSSEYAALFTDTGVAATLGAKGPYTVFVSTNGGYALLKPGTISNMTAAQKKRMIQYSVISGRALDVNVQDSGQINALSGDKLNFSVGSTGLVQVNSSYALAAYKATNGVVYVINQPLIPPTSGNILTP